MEKQIKKCPVCGSTKLSMEKRLYGNTLCMDCGYENKHLKFEISDHERVITHEEIRKQIGVWSRSARPMMYSYISQCEQSEKFAKTYLKDTQKLVELYRRLVLLRDYQLKNISLSEKETNVDYDIYLRKKIERLRIKLGLPPDNMEVQNVKID